MEDTINHFKLGFVERIYMEEYFKIFITPKIKAAKSNKPKYGYCWRMYGEKSAGHFHLFWECCIVSSFWEKVVSEIRSIFSSEIDFNFSVVYLGNLPPELHKQNKYLLQISLAGCKKAITTKWVSDEPPTLSE